MKISPYLVIVLALFIVSCGSSKELEKLKKQMKLQSMDTDGDGIPNMYDREDSTYMEAKVYGDGTSVDQDYDGVPDHLDVELNSPLYAQVDSTGKALDTDNDGVPDEIDMENNTPEGQIVNFRGQSITSGSGVSARPLLSGSKTVANEIGSAFPIVLFSYSFEIEEFVFSDILKVFNYMSANPNVRLKVIGHTDNIGSEEANIRLGLNRANAVIKVLKSLGISEDRLIAESRGESEPRVAESSLTLQKFNRRVEFQVAQ